MATIISLLESDRNHTFLQTTTTGGTESTTAQVSLGAGMNAPMLSFTTIIQATSGGASGSASCILQGSFDNSNWVTIQTVTQGGTGAIATAGSTTAKPFTWIRHNVSPNTGANEVTRVDTLAMPQ